MRDTPPPSTGHGPAGAALMAPRGASAVPPSRSDQGAAAPGSGGAGPGLGPEAPTPTCARTLWMTAGSCRMAIRRSRPPQWGHARTAGLGHTHTVITQPVHIVRSQPMTSALSRLPRAQGTFVGSGRTAVSLRTAAQADGERGSGTQRGEPVRKRPQAGSVCACDLRDVLRRPSGRCRRIRGGPRAEAGRAARRGGGVG